MITSIVVCVVIFVVVLCIGAFIYDNYRKDNLSLMSHNEITYDECEGLPYGADSRVHVEEKISL